MLAKIFTTIIDNIIFLLSKIQDKLIGLLLLKNGFKTHKLLHLE